MAHVVCQSDHFVGTNKLFGTAQQNATFSHSPQRVLVVQPELLVSTTIANESEPTYKLFIECHGVEFWCFVCRSLRREIVSRGKCSSKIPRVKKQAALSSIQLNTSVVVGPRPIRRYTIRPYLCQDMAANFWNSTHYRHWLRKVDEVYKQADAMMKKDQSAFKEDEQNSIKVIYSQIISTLAMNSNLRQRVAATAIVYYRRFFARNAVRDHDPRLIAPVALYLAAKAEEHTLAAKIVVQHMMEIYQADHAYPYTVAHVYDYEFKLIAALEFDLIIYHPYRPMIQYCADASFHDLVTAAWPILNDSYRTDACLRYPPYLIAIACIYIAGTLQDREMTSWVKKMNIDLQEVADIIQYLSVMYANPSSIRTTGPQVERINNKLQSHFGPKIQNIQSGISKKPPSSSRPKVSLKLAE